MTHTILKQIGVNSDESVSREQTILERFKVSCQPKISEQMSLDDLSHQNLSLEGG